MKVKVINKSSNKMPSYATIGSAGIDLIANIDHDITIEPGKRQIIPTGFYIEIPDGQMGMITPRSGLAAKNGISIVNSPGIIDCVPEGTMIKTIDGDCRVEDLFNSNNRTVIYSYNEEEDTIEEDTIGDMWIVKNKELLLITDTSGNDIEIPYDKEVYTKRGWVMAKDLLLDDEVLRF
jgi:dUTP pyrophosphatase